MRGRFVQIIHLIRHGFAYHNGVRNEFGEDRMRFLDAHLKHKCAAASSAPFALSQSSAAYCNQLTSHACL